MSFFRKGSGWSSRLDFHLIFHVISTVHWIRGSEKASFLSDLDSSVGGMSVRHAKLPSPVSHVRESVGKDCERSGKVAVVPLEKHADCGWRQTDDV